MPMMKPPHYQGVMYAGRAVPIGGSISVDANDVEALTDEGWSITGMTDEEAAAEIAKHDTATRRKRRGEE